MAAICDLVAAICDLVVAICDLVESGSQQAVLQHSACAWGHLATSGGLAANWKNLVTTHLHVVATGNSHLVAQ